MSQYLYGLLGVCVILLITEQIGEYRIQTKWDLEKARLETIAKQEKQRDKEANVAIEKQHKKDIEYAKSQAGKRAISDWLKSHCMLPSGASVSGSSDCKTESTAKPNDTAGQSGTSNRIEEFAQGCALDALQVLNWQEWAIREGLEVK